MQYGTQYGQTPLGGLETTGISQNTKTQSGKLNISVTRTKAQGGIVNVKLPGGGVKNQYSKLRIKATLTNTQSGKLKILLNPLKLIYGKLRITATLVKNQTRCAGKSG